MSSRVIVKDSLPIGVEVDGVTYRDFEMRAAVLRDSVDAVDECGGDASQTLLRYAVMARRVKFEGLDQEKVTTDLLMNMLDRDGVALEQAADEVEKKLDALSSS